jgi:hippurate hydrolase
MIDLLKKYRRDLHQIPEPFFKEYKTASYLRKTLTNMGYQPFQVLETDVLVYIDAGSDETIAFRSDIDALQIKEENQIDFKSKHEGYMHACGHDGHMSMLLAFANYLSDKTDKLNKNILLIFQPAEESIGGALKLIEKNILRDYNVKKIFGIHLFPEIDEGVLASKPNEFMAMASEINIEIFGKSAHGAMPQTGVDSNLIMSKLLIEFQSIQTRMISPIEPTIITFGKIEGGFVRNILSDYAKMEGTIRVFKKDTFDFITKSIKQICEGFEKAYQCTINFEFTNGYLPVINDAELFDLFKKANKNIPIHQFQSPLMIAEDFSFYQNEIPGLFYYVGTRNEQDGLIHSLHNSKFNFNENALKTGVDSYINILKELNVI